MIPSSNCKIVIEIKICTPAPLAGACHYYLIYLIIDCFNESVDFREEGLGHRAATAESKEDSLGEEGEVTEYGVTNSLVGQRFEGVKGDSLPFLQQPQEGCWQED